MKKRAKNFLALLLSAVVAFSGFAVGLTANAESLTSGIFTYEIVDGEVKITGCDHDVEGEVVVPSHIGGYPVTTIGEYAFGYSDYVTKLILPDTVIVVEEIDVDEIVFGNSVTKAVNLGLHCRGKDVTLPNSLIVLENATYIFCENLHFGKNLRYYDVDSSNARVKSFSVDKDNPYYTTIDGVLFSKDGKTLIDYPAESTATSYTVPSTVETISRHAFANAKNLVQVNIPDSVKQIESHVFMSCQNLNEINIGNGIEFIGEMAFYDTAIYNNSASWVNGILYVDDCAITYNESLPKNASIKNGTRLIAETAFIEAPCETIDIPDTVKHICERAFYMSKLKTVEIPGSVDSLSWRVFDCVNLESITIADGVKSLCDSSINSRGLTSLKLGNGIEYISGTAMYESAFVKDKNNYNGNELIVDNYIIEAEYNTRGIYHISKDIRGVSADAFISCTQVTGFSVDKDNPYFSIDEYGVLFNKDKTVLIAFPRDCGITEYTVPSTVKKIGEYAFTGLNRDLKKLNLSEGLVEIGEYAFSSNNTIEEINFPGTLERINKDAFGNCYALKSAELPEGLIFIDDCAFDDCRSLKTVTIPDSVTEMGRSVFRGCSGLESATVGSGMNELPPESFESCTSLKSIILKNSIDFIDYDVFWEMPLLSDVYYTGTKEQWRAIIIEDEYSNGELFEATIHYNHVIEDAPSVHKHNYTSTVTTRPTCEKTGVRTFTCSCGKSYTESISKNPHALGEWVVITEPTIIDYGKKVQYCSTCGNAFNETLIDKLISELNIQIIAPETIVAYGNSMVLNFNNDAAMQLGWTIKWTASNDNFAYTVSDDGRTCTVTPMVSGVTTFTAVVYDENDEAIGVATQELTSKAGFFEKAAAFFKEIYNFIVRLFQSLLELF